MEPHHDLRPRSQMNAPTVLDVPSEVARCPFCGGALQAKVSPPAHTVGDAPKVTVYCKDAADVPFETLEHLVWRKGLSRWGVAEATVKVWVQAQRSGPPHP